MQPHLSRLNVYPLKSASGIRLARAELDALGLRQDRRWLVVDGAGAFITQREAPQLALVRAALDADALRLWAPRAGSLTLPLHGLEGRRRPVEVWGDRVDAVDAGAASRRWASALVGREASVVWLGESSERQVAPDHGGPDDHIAFVDGFPLLIISEASLDALNRRLEMPVPMDRFRPNLVVAGTVPHAEDDWRRIRIGDVVMDIVKPCARCVVTTTDQQTGVRSPEPLRTLATYRKRGGKVLFGQNGIHRTLGILREGQSVEVLEVAYAG